MNPAFAAGYDLSQLSSGTDTIVNDSLSHSSSGSGEHAAGTGDQLRRKANRLVNNAVVFLRKQTADSSDALSLASLVNQVREIGSGEHDEHSARTGGRLTTARVSAL